MADFLERVFPTDQCLPDEMIAEFGRVMLKHDIDNDPYIFISARDTTMAYRGSQSHVQDFFDITSKRSTGVVLTYDIAYGAVQSFSRSRHS